MATILDDSIAGRGYGGIGLGGGDSGLGLVALLALLGRGRLGGGDECGTGNALDAAILNAVNGITSAVPTTALETQAAVTHAIGSLALGTQQGFANIKDSVQAASALNLSAINNTNQNVLITALQTQIAGAAEHDKTRELIRAVNDSNLQRELTVAQSALAEERNSRRIRDVEVSVNQSVTQTQAQGQVQAQAQQQAQFLAGILAEVRNLAGDIQAVKQGQVIFNSGAMTASGTQAAANTKVA